MSAVRADVVRVRAALSPLLAGFACTLVVWGLSVAAPLRAQGGDTVASRLGAAVFACKGTLDLGEVSWLETRPDAKLPYYVRRARDGGVVSVFGPAPGFVGSMAMEGLARDASVLDTELARRARHAAALLTAISTGLLFVALRASASTRIAAFGALVAGLSYAGAATAGQGLWQFTTALPFLCGAIACLAWAPRSRLARVLCPSLLLVWWQIRPTAVGLALGVGLAWLASMWFFEKRRPRVIWATVAVTIAIAVSLPFAIYNQAKLGTPIPIAQYEAASKYAQAGPRFALSPSHLVSSTLGLLASPGRGLLFFAPIVLVGFVDLARSIRRPTSTFLASDSSVFAWARLGLFFQFSVAAGWFVWWGGVCFGPRLVAEAVWLGVAAVFATHAARSRIGRACAIAAGVLTTAVGLLGLFRHDPRLWDLRRDIEHNQSVVWDFSDSPISALLTRSPPDDELVDAPRGPYLFCPQEGQALRLLETPAAR